MEYRAFLAIVLSLLVFIVWNYLIFSHNGGRLSEGKIDKGTGISEESVKTKPVQPSPPSSNADKGMMVSNQQESLKELGMVMPLNEEKGRDIIIDTDLMRVTLNTKGGNITHLSMKHYLTNEGLPLDFVRERGISLSSLDENLAPILSNIIFDSNLTGLGLTPNKPEGTIRMVYKSPNGLELVKTYTFYYDSYSINMGIEGSLLSKLKDVYLQWGPGISGEGNNGGTGYYYGPTTFVEDAKINDNKIAVNSQVIHNNNVVWTSIQNKYFAVAIFPQDRSPNTKAIIKKFNSEDEVAVGLFLPEDIEGAKSKVVTLYAGPKEIDRLELYNVKLEQIIDYGWGNMFAFLVRPLLKVLKFLYRFTYSYGVSIILLTVLIKLLFFPLTQKSFSSMKKMQNIQPQLKIIQERYKNDRQKLNEEMMRLYREHKINPLGGCLPVLLQIPVFIALYHVLLSSIELRHAPFLWLKDLAEKDPTYITPILMGVSMLIQQKMTPSAGDPMQQRIMMILPVIFTFMFLNFPVGLVLYWLVNNIMTIVQQYLLYKKNS